MSSIMKGIVDEGEEVAVIYIDGKPSAKYAKKHEAERDAEFMRKRHPNKKIEIKHEVRETEEKSSPYKEGYKAWKDYLAGKTKQRPVNPYPAGKGMGAWEQGAGDAAEHIDWGEGPLGETEAKKGAGEVVKKVFKHKGKPVGEIGVDLASSPGGGMYYMKYYGSGKAVSGYDSMEEAFAVLKHYLNQMKEGAIGETEAKKGADGKRCWKGKRYAGTENGKDKCIPVKEESETKWEVAIEYGPTANHTAKIKVSAPDADTAQSKALAQFKKKFPDRRGMVGDCTQIKEAANPAQQAAIAIAKKKKAKTNEGVIVGHDANDPEVAILGGAGTMSLSRLKKKAHQEALQLADDIANGKYSASSYNMKQLHNTLNTIVAAEKEMEKSYFGEAVDWQRGENNNEHDHTLKDAEEYLTHLYPVVKKYMIRRAEVGFRAGLRPNEKEFMKSMSHMKDVDAVIKYLGLNKLPTMSGSKQATSSIGYTWTTFLSPNKKAAIIYYQDRGMGQDMIYIAAADKALHRKIYDLFVDAGVIVGRDKKVKEPELPQGMRVSGATSRDDAYNRAMNKFLGKNDDDGVNEDYTGEFAAEKTPAVNPYGGLKDRKFRGTISETPTDNPTGASGEGGWRKYKPKSAGTVEEAKKSQFRQQSEQQQLEKLEKIANSSLPHWAKEYLTLLNDPRGKVFKAGYYSFSKGQAAREEVAQYIMNKYKVPQHMLDKVKHGEMAHVAMDRPEDRNYDFDVPSVHEDTAYAGGMGQGHSGESYRKFKPKSAGTFKESAILKGINSKRD